MSSQSPTLKDLLSAAADGQVTTTPMEQFGRQARSRERRRRLSAAAAVTAVVTGVAIVGAVLVTAGSQPPKPAPPSSLRHAHHPGLVRETDLSSQSGLLRFEAPAGVVRWTFKTTPECQVNENWLPAPGHVDHGKPPPNSRFATIVGPSPGGAGGGAGFGTRCLNPRLVVSVSGSTGLNEQAFTYIGGRLGEQYVGRSMRVRVTLADGQSVIVQPQHGLWLAVAQRCGNYPGTAFTTVELINPDGTVARSTQVPADYYLSIRDGEAICAGLIGNNLR